MLTNQIQKYQSFFLKKNWQIFIFGYWWMQRIQQLCWWGSMHLPSWVLLLHMSRRIWRRWCSHKTKTDHITLIISLNEYINCFPWNKSHLTVSVSVITLLNGSFYAYLALKKRNLKTYTTFQPSTPIIHRDVKTSNVLDHNLTANFGILDLLGLFLLNEVK
jgi:hypothetical protein